MSPCVEWQGSRMNTGYGIRYFPSSFRGAKDKRYVLAHRAAWEEANGPIPTDAQVHHRCENRLCVNVEHLELLDVRHHAGGGAHGKFTQADADAIRAWRAEGWPGNWLATAFGCSQQQICNIAKGRCWA